MIFFIVFFPRSYCVAFIKYFATMTARIKSFPGYCDVPGAFFIGNFGPKEMDPEENRPHIRASRRASRRRGLCFAMKGPAFRDLYFIADFAALYIMGV